MIKEKDGRFNSKKTLDEIEKTLKTDISRLSPEEREVLQIIIDEHRAKAKGQLPADRPELLQVFRDSEYKWDPVDIRTFVMDPYYLGVTCDVIYPELLKDLEELFAGDYHEAIWCLHPDTRIPLLDGSTKTIKELAENWEMNPEPFWVYSVNSEGSVISAQAEHPRLTGVDDYYKVALDDGTSFTGNSRHQMVMRDGTKRMIRDMKPGDSIMPFHAKHGEVFKPRNHSVVSIEKAGQGPVYCMTVPGPANFAICTDEDEKGNKNGVFSKNTGAIGTGKCVHSDTQIYDPVTGRRRLAREIGSLSVLSMTGTGKLEPKQATAFKSGKKKCIKVTAAAGQSITLSLDHPIYTPDGWVPAGRLRVGDLIATPRKLPPPKNPTRIPDSEVKLVSYLLSDGGLTNNITFTNMSDVLVGELRGLVEELGETINGKPPAVYLQPSQNSGKVASYNVRGVSGITNKYDLRHPARSNRIPAEFYGLSDRQIGLFLNRFIACDGSLYIKGSGSKVPTPVIEIGLSSEDMIDDLKFLFLRLGVIARKGLTKKSFTKTDGTKGKVPAWILTVSNKPDVLKALKCIGPVVSKEPAYDRLMAACLTPPVRAFNTNVDIVPVGVRGIIKDSDLLWEKVKSVEDQGFQTVYDLNVPDSHNFVGNNIVLHNTFIASIGICRILYEISCMKNPHKSFGLAPETNISIVAFSVTETLARKVVFENIATKVKSSDYFNKHFPFKDTKTEMRFPNNVWVAARSSTDTSALGLNAIAAIMDEANFMHKGHTAAGAVNQAESLYNNIIRRMVSRYDNSGKLPGIFFLISSKNTVDDFINARARTGVEDPTLFVRDRSLWSVKPENYPMDDPFWVLVGNATIPSKILDPGEELDRLQASLPEGAVLIKVPRLLRQTFENDLEGCVTGDTEVSLTDGTEIPIKDLQGSDGVWVYSCREDGEVVPALARDVRLTHENARIFRVSLDNGEHIDCTPDHLFMLRNGTYKEAANLLEGDSLMPLYRRHDRDGHEFFKNNKTNRWNYTHRLGAKQGLNKGKNISSNTHLNSYNECKAYLTASINHKVVKVEPRGTADVYDLTVDGLHNFAVKPGVFIHNSIRDVAGISTVSVSPFIQRREKIVEAIDQDRQHPFSVMVYDPSQPGAFLWDRMVAPSVDKRYGSSDTPKIRPIINPMAPRSVHIDPSLNGDATGICVAHIGGYKDIIRTADDGSPYTERSPVFVVDFILKIVPPTGDEIVFGQVRQLVYEMTAHGYIITNVTQDSWNPEGIQAFKLKGYNSGLLSVDRTTEAYDHLKACLYENRLYYYEYPPLLEELRTIEENRKNPRKRKIDHPEMGSKDTSDALAGCMWTLRENQSGQIPLPLIKEKPRGADTWLKEQREAALAQETQSKDSKDLDDWGMLPPFLTSSGNNPGDWGSGGPGGFGSGW